MKWKIRKNKKAKSKVERILKNPNIDYEERIMDLENIIREQEKTRTDIDRGIDELVGPDYRIITLSDWLTAVRSCTQPWQNSFQPNWVLLFDIFFNLVEDPHVSACIDTLTEGVLSKDFYVADKDGNKLDEVTELFKSSWFEDYVRAIVNVRLWGFGLIQIRKLDRENMTIVLDEVNRKHVRPDLGGVVKQEYDRQAFKFWDQQPYKTSTIYIFENVLGKLNKCVRWWIYKTEVARIWAKYNQMFGTPPIVAKTALKDTTRKKNAINMLKSWIKTRWLVADKEDEIVPFGSNDTGSGQQYFENFINLCNKEISKALLGSTMVLEDGSSRSQSEVHLTNTDRFIKSLCRKSSYVSKELINRLNKIGFPVPKSAKIIWEYSEKTTMKDKAIILDIIKKNFDIDTNDASEFIGIELNEKEVLEVENFQGQQSEDE